MRPRETTSRSKNVISLLLHWLQGGNKHNKKMLPSVPSADPASGSRSRRFHRPTLISPPISNLSPLSCSSPIPPSRFNQFQSSPSFQSQSKFSRATFWRANNWPAAVGEPPCFDSFLLQGLSLSKWTASKAAIRSNLWNGVF